MILEIAQIELKAAVREAIEYVAGKQIECGIDVINDGEQGRTDYTVHVLDRLAGFEGESSPPLGTGEPEFPERAGEGRLAGTGRRRTFAFEAGEAVEHVHGVVGAA